MKKLILILIAGIVSAPLFAFDFNTGNFDINSSIKAEINSVVEQEVNTVIRKIPAFKKNNAGKKSEHPILSEIRQAMENEKKNIDRNIRTRRVSPINKIFKEQQLVQQHRFENMMEWNVPTKIFNYIDANFDVHLIKNIKVICTHVNGTIIEVRFPYNGESVKVFYTYTDTPEQLSITHEIIK